HTLPDKHKNYHLRQALFRRCNLSQLLLSLPDDHKPKMVKLSSATLQLFEDVLSRPSMKIVDSLITEHIRSRQYLAEMTTDGDEAHLEPEPDGLVSDKFNSLTVLDEMQNSAVDVCRLANVAA